MITLFFTIATIIIIAILDRKFLNSLTPKYRVLFWLGFLLSYGSFILTNKICHYYFAKWYDIIIGFTLGMFLMIQFQKYYWKLISKYKK